MDLFDAVLTAQGEEQARAAAASFPANLKVDLALTSPLTRAARTCVLALPPGHRGAKRYMVTPLMSEHLEASCDIGRTPKELAAAFPELDFRHLPDVWWYVPEEHRQGITPEGSQRLFTEEGRREPRSAFLERVDAFAELVAGASEGTIAAFAHADFFHEFLSRYFAQNDSKYEEYWMKNCEVLALRLEAPSALARPADPEAEAEAEAEAPAPAQAEAEAEAEAAAAEAEAVPKRQPSGAMLGLSTLKKEISSQNPGLQPSELQRKVSTTWKSLDPAERERYMNLRN